MTRSQTCVITWCLPTLILAIPVAWHQVKYSDYYDAVLVLSILTGMALFRAARAVFEQERIERWKQKRS